MNNEQTNKNKYYDTFYGHKVSDYALQYGRLDYATLSKCFDCVLCNNIGEVDETIWENVESGDLMRYYYDGEEITHEEYDNKLEELENKIATLSIKENYKEIEELEEEKEKYEEEVVEIFQYYIVSDNALHLLQECNELVLYSEKLDCYIWCVDHCGTSWDYVLTSLKLKERE